MRRIIELSLVLAVSCISLGTAAGAAEAVPYILGGIILCCLSLLSFSPRSGAVLAGVYFLIWLLFPGLSIGAPLLCYGLFQKNRWLSGVALATVVFVPKPVFFIASLLALWMSWQELRSRESEQAYYTMRDDFVQNEILQHRILKEEESNHEKNLEIAVLHERNRISREIHDSVGHTISAALLQIEALKVSAEGPVKDKLSALSNALSRGMEEVRRSLHNLHNESISLAVEVARLTAPLEETYQITKTIQIDDAVPMPVKQAMLSLLREALTNIRRHSDATQIRVMLRDLPQHYTITVKDNGSQKAIQSGIGLSSMEEISRSLGGVFSRGWSEGFFVHMAVPKEMPAQSETQKEKADSGTRGTKQ